MVMVRDRVRVMINSCPPNAKLIVQELRHRSARLCGFRVRVCVRVRVRIKFRYRVRVRVRIRVG